MENPLLWAAVTTLVPGMFVLWQLLGRYEDLFDQGRAFFALIVGLFVGIVTAFFEINLFAFQFPVFEDQVGWGLALAWSVLGYALFETGIKAIVIGLGRFRNRKDTPFYGMTMGLSMGAMISVQAIGFQVALADKAGNPYQILPYFAMAAVPVGAMFAHAASGIMVAKGAADGSLGRGWALGMAIQIPALAAMWVFWQNIGAGNALIVLPGAISLAYGGVVLWQMRSRILDHVVPPEIRDQVRRQNRRDVRRQNRGDVLAAGAVGGASANLTSPWETPGDEDEGDVPASDVIPDEPSVRADAPVSGEGPGAEPDDSTVVDSARKDGEE